MTPVPWVANGFMLFYKKNDVLILWLKHAPVFYLSFPFALNFVTQMVSIFSYIASKLNMLGVVLNCIEVYVERGK